jgi:dynein heavy chain
MSQYDKVVKKVAPLRVALTKAEENARKANEALEEKRTKLQNVQEKLNRLKNEQDECEQHCKAMQEGIDLCRMKLKRAKKLIEVLEAERNRWSSTAEALGKKEDTLTGEKPSLYIKRLSMFPFKFSLAPRDGGILHN